MTNQQLLHRLVSYSMLATLLLGLATFTVTTRHTSGSLVWSDGLPYFLYSRSIVLDLNTDLTNEYDEIVDRHPAESKLLIPLKSWTRRDPESGGIIAPWPVGTGLVMAPFYALGYITELAVATASGRSTDSYGLIPQYFFCIGSLLFGLLGFWSMFLCCRELVDNTAAALASLGVLLGGPAVFYIFLNPSMAHSVSLGLTALLTLLWLRQWLNGSDFRGMALLGLILGTAITVRYQNALFGILPLALVIREALRQPFSRLVLISFSGLISLLIPVTLQLAHLYIFAHTGETISTQQGGILIGQYPFDLRSPYFFHVLFSSRHGAFYWAPTLAMGTIGLVWATCRQSWAWPLLIALLANVWLIGALGLAYSGPSIGTGYESNWNTHWHGAPAFGMRYLTECGPLFAIGLAVLIKSSTRWLGNLFWPVVLSLLAIWNGLLILAYGLETISRYYSLTYRDMLVGVIEAVRSIAERVF